MVSKFSVKKPYTVLVGVVLAIVLGVVSFTRMTTDLLPNISLPYVIVMTTYPGASPETVETVVTQPVEASMATVSNIAGINSVSGENYSMVILEFAQTADMNATSLEIRENLDQITSYWDDAIGNPIIMKLNPDMLPVMIAAVGVEGMDYAQVSTYVKESVIPELESIEGVASVSASGLLEESVNVIIRQEKVDALNEKIFAAIDKEMEDARKELAEGKQEILDGQKELADGKKEIKDGQKELDEGKAELVSGKTELENKKNETYQQLANTKRDLLTAKDNLEASKIGLTTDLSTAKGLDAGVKEIDMVLGASGSYQTAMTQYQQALLSGDAAAAAVEKAKIEELKKNYIASKILTGALEAAPALAPMFEPLKTADWTDTNQMQVILPVLMGVETQMSVPLTEQKTNLADALNALTNGLGLTAFETTVNQAINTIDYNLNNVNNGLVEVEKGMLAAATEFANASTGITLGEYQMEQAQQQLDSALEQLKSGEEQLQDALKQIEDGEQQLADAQQSAYESADMNQVLTVSMISNLLVAQNFSMPAGYVTEDGIDYLVRVGDKPESVEELQQMPLMDLHMEGVPVVTLGDVADVFYTDNSASIYTNVDGSAGVMLTLQKQTGYSTGSVSDILAERFAQMMEKNDKLSIITLMDQGIYIDLVMDSIISNIGFGFFLAILILIIFLKDLRPTLVIACSIPISLVTAIVCMYFSGVTLNVISLSGLALGIGMLVDNSIVVIENIYRLRSEGYSMREAAIEGSKEVAGAILASTLTTICVFLPIVFTEGITRQLFVDMGLTIGYSLLASLVIALTVVPAMSSKMLTKTKEKKQGRFYEAFVNGYEKVLKVSLKIKPVVFVLVLLLLVGSILAAYTNGTAFMTDMDSTQLTVTVQMPKEATLAETGEVTDRVVERIMEIPDVSNVGAMASSSSTSLIGGSSATNATTIYVVTYEDKSMSNEEIGKLIVEKTADLTAEITVNTSSMDMSALGGSGISIQVEGRDLDTLQRIAKEVAAIVTKVEGVTNVSDGLGEAEEEMRVIVDRNKAVSYGLTVAQVFQEIYGKLAEAGAATTLEAANKDYGVYVMDGEDITLTRELVKQMTISGTDAEGEKVKIPLSEIADFETATSLSSINRSEQTRYIAVSAGIAEGYNVGLVAPEVEKALEDYQVPDGYQLVFTGENETIMDAMQQMVLMLVLAVVFMYLIMVAQFQSLLSPFIIMFTIPLAFTGGFLGLFISGSEISVIAMIGFVMLAGVIVNNGIVLIDYMNQLRERGMEKREAILTAGRTRLRPVLMTALTTIMALLTMVFGQDMGSEMARPMAIVTVGGLLYGTLLTLIVIPCIYDCFIREKNKEVSEEV